MKTLIGIFTAFSFGLIVLVLDGFYIVNEGHVGVKTVWGEAVSQENPSGLKVKMPIQMAAATANQLPIQADVSVNWRLDPTAVLDTFRNYGSPEAFETTVLDPRLRQAAKAGLSKYQASDLIRDRSAASETILTYFREAMEGYPASVLSLQIENVSLPERYMESVMKKEEAREDAVREEYRLKQQRLTAQQTVQTAEAEREAAKARADGQAYSIVKEAEAEAESIRLRAEAEAEGIERIENALANNPLLVDYERTKRWNGQLPTMMLGQNTDFLMSMPVAEK